MEEKTLTFSWEVKNFSLCTLPKGCAMMSERFVAGILNNTQWITLLHPRSDYDPDFISLFLERCDETHVSIELHVAFRLIAVDGTPGQELILTGNTSKYNTYGFPLFTSRSDVEMFYLHDDTLKIQCVLKINKEFITQGLFARTSCSVRKICKKWSLANFSQATDGGLLEDSLKLQEVGVSSLYVCLSIQRISGREVLMIQFTRLCNPLGNPFDLHVLMTVLDRQGVESEISKRDNHFFHMRTPVDVWQFQTPITKDSIVKDRNKYLENDVLKLNCDFIIYSGTMISEKTSFSVMVRGIRSSDEFAKSMEDLYNVKRFADVKLRVGTETVPAHRIVLQSRSRWFAEMLDVESEDADVLDVPDVDMVTLKRMLKFMYTDYVDDLKYDDLVIAYIAAHKYQLEAIKCKYSFALQSRMNFSNICSSLMLADEFYDRDLKNCAVGFIKHSFGRVCLSDEWEELSKRSQILAQETKKQLSRTFVIKHCAKYA